MILFLELKKDVISQEKSINSFNTNFFKYIK